jgi:hypothetical protein
MAKRVSHNYIDNEKFYEEIKDYIMACRDIDNQNEKSPDDTIIPYPQTNDYIAECIFQIAENLSRKGNFCNYTFRDEMVGDAVENCYRYIRNFDPDKYKNPFAYYTQICYFAFIRRINNEKDYKIAIYKLISDAVREDDFTKWAKQQNLDLDGKDTLADYFNINPDDIEKLEKEAKKENNKKKLSKKSILKDLEED